MSLNVASLTISPRYALKMITPFEGRDFRVRSQVNCRAFFDASNQISRHALCQPARTDQHVHALGGLREEYRGLPRRVPCSDDDHLCTATQLRLKMSSAVIDASAFKLRQAIERKFAILRTSRDHDGAGRHSLTVIHLDRVRLPIARQVFGSFRDQHLGSELLSLRVRAPGEVLSREAGGKAEVVLDFRTRTSLSARRVRFQH